MKWQIFLLILGISSVAFSQKDFAVSSKKELGKNIKEQRTNFNQCRKDALSSLKKKKSNKKQFKALIKTCHERFPAAGIYQSCRKATFAKYKDSSKSQLKQALSKCRKLLKDFMFSADNPLPFHLHKSGKIFFSGVGINETTPIKSLDIPNFDCSTITPLIDNLQKADYLLFGNHPKNFAFFEDQSTKRIYKALGLKKKYNKEQYVKNYGQVSGNLNSKKGSIYFPLGRCFFERKLGAFFKGINIYYLINKPSKQLTPYFGIAHYNKIPHSTDELKNKLLETLNQSSNQKFKTFSKKASVSFIATHKFLEFDEEGDPQHICTEPRHNSVVAILKSSDDNPQIPEYLLLANVRNLCNFGDKLTAQLFSSD